MSLRNLHICFIALSVALAAGFGLWCFLADDAGAVSGAGVMGSISLVAAVALVIYAVAFLKKLNREGIK